jgi:hypothetical protein
MVRALYKAGLVLCFLLLRLHLIDGQSLEVALLSASPAFVRLLLDLQLLPRTLLSTLCFTCTERSRHRTNSSRQQLRRQNSPAPTASEQQE